MIKPVVNSIVRPVVRGIVPSFSRNWTQRWKSAANFYELWKVTGAGTMIGLRRGDPMTITGSGLNAIYAVPDTAPYKTRDTDYVFHKSDGSISTACDGNRLVTYDFAKIIVKYLDVAPYTIEYIGILDTGQSVTNQMCDDFHLSIWWDNTLSSHGNPKQNRVVGKSSWSPESVYDVDSQALFARMTALSETPTTARKINIDTAIKALKANNLWSRFDALWVCRAHGTGSAKLNWVKNAHNLSKVGAGTLTFTTDLGFKGDGSCAIDSGYNLATNGINFTQNSAGFGIKVSGTLTANKAHGAMNTGNSNATYFYNNTLTDGTGRQYINEVSGPTLQLKNYKIGYNMITRQTNLKQFMYRDDGSFEDTDVSTYPSVPRISLNMYFLAGNLSGVISLASATEVLEIGWFSDYFTLAEERIVEGIMNTYIANL